MKKYLMTAILALCLCVAPVGAATPQPGVSPLRAEVCGNCGNTTLTASTTYSSWTDTATTVQCKKYTTRRDIVQERQVYTKYRCGSCKYTRTATSTQTRIYCSH